MELLVQKFIVVTVSTVKRISNMKFIKQVSEDEFIVKMGPEDTNKTRRIVLAHDYLQFQGLNWYCTDLSNLDTPWAFGNVIKVQSRIQIPIRMAQDMLEKVLTKDRQYLKSEHLVRDGNNVYCDSEGMCYHYYDDNHTEMMAIYNSETDKYVHMTKSIYDSICKTVKNK